MNFLDLNAAFKMACELQQHIVNAVFTHKDGGNIIQIKPDPDEAQNQTDTVEVCPETNVVDNQAEPVAITGSSCVTDDIVSSTVISRTEEPKSNLESSSKSISSPQPINPHATDNESTNLIKHRLVAMEAYYANRSVDLTDSESTAFQLPCSVCKLRVPSGPGAQASMVCPACTDKPAICSAQCFRWLHSRMEQSTPHKISTTNNVVGISTAFDQPSSSSCINSRSLISSKSFNPSSLVSYPIPNATAAAATWLMTSEVVKLSRKRNPRRKPIRKRFTAPPNRRRVVRT